MPKLDSEVQEALGALPPAERELYERARDKFFPLPDIQEGHVLIGGRQYPMVSATFRVERQAISHLSLSGVAANVAQPSSCALELELCGAHVFTLDDPTPAKIIFRHNGTVRVLDAAWLMAVEGSASAMAVGSTALTYRTDAPIRSYAVPDDG